MLQNPDNTPEPQVSAVHPDWSREKTRRLFDPARRMLLNLRRYEAVRARRGPWNALLRKWYAGWHRFWSVCAGAEISLGTQIGGGLLLPHPSGIVIHPEAIVGVNCLIFQQVTLGDGGAKPGVPRLGGHVDIGAGAKLLGGIVVGDHAKIGANAVVLHDVPPGATAVGIPARVIPPKPAIEHQR
jgi:serine O-acetyltransferase